MTARTLEDIPPAVLLSVVDELRRPGSAGELLFQTGAPGPGSWAAADQFLYFGQRIIARLADLELLDVGRDEGGRPRRIRLRPEPAIAPIVKQLEAADSEIKRGRPCWIR